MGRRKKCEVQGCLNMTQSRYGFCSEHREISDHRAKARKKYSDTPAGVDAHRRARKAYLLRRSTVCRICNKPVFYTSLLCRSHAARERWRKKKERAP